MTEQSDNPDLPDLVAIKARMLAATPGDWQWEGVPDLTLGDEVLEGVDRFMITAFGDDNEQSIVLAAEPIGSRVGVSDADAEFIAAARTDIPALIAEIRRLWTQMDVACGAADAVVSVLERFRDEEDHDA